MPCVENPETIGAWIDGELDASRAAEIAAHLSACPACAARARAYERLGAAVRNPALVMAPPPRLARRVAAAGRRRASRRPRARRVPRALDSR